MKIHRRHFLRSTSILGLSSIITPRSTYPYNVDHGEILYNGIQLPQQWPPRDLDPLSYDPMIVPYLSSPPEIIPIDIGRQLFIDDFLIEQSNLLRSFHRPVKYLGNPIFKAETALEKGPFGIPGASPKDGGIWWDPKQRMFKMWYEAGWLYTLAYAVSADGIHWERPPLDFQKGTNRILPHYTPDSTTVFIDPHTSDPKSRFKMFLRPPNEIPGRADKIHRGFCMTSGDGIYWNNIIETGICGDRSTMFYNPFRKKWVYSIRSASELGKSPNGRARYYREHDDFLKGATWELDDPVYWAGADRLDKPDPELGIRPQLYNLSANAYESLMLGYFQIWLGPSNKECKNSAKPKITDLKIAFSRDGFHWDRTNRDVFIPSSRKLGVWDMGYVQSVGGICSVVGDKLWFYYIGFEGDQTRLNPVDAKNGMYSKGSTGIAILRRDGFASMDADEVGGTLTTRKVVFSGKHLFVNTNCLDGELRVEILDSYGRIIPGFESYKCNPLSVDSTIQEVTWRGINDLSSLSKVPVRFTFYIKHGSLFAFWISPGKSGASHGYNAAGGPGFSGPIDIEGKAAYHKAEPFKL